MKSIKLVSWLKPFFVLSIICGFALTATAQNHFPSTIGNTWVLLSTDGAEQRTYTFEGPETINGEEFTILKIAKETVGTDTVAFDKSWVTVAEDGEIILHQVAFDRGAFGIAEATFDPPVTNFPAALPLGHTWEIVTETVLQLVGAATTTSTLEVVAIEDVETPIGVFKDCVKIEINRKAVTALTIVRENEFLWLAPDVGPVKFQDTNEIVFDLASYDLVEPADEEMPVVEEMPPTEETTEEVTEETTEEVTEETTEEPTEVEMPVSQMFEIKLTNLTMGVPGMGGQVFSHPIFVTHAAGINLAEVGQPANPALVLLAENGDPSGLVALATAAGANSLVADSLVPPGGSITVTVTADAVNSSLSVGTMLVSTNDGFVAATDVALFDENGMPVTMSIPLNSYDAGSEDNTELGTDIPGPVDLPPEDDPEGSNARVPTKGGVIMPHEGIQGVGDVGETFEWEEPTAMLTITPVEEPAEPMVEEPMPTKEYGFDIMLEPGLNMIAIPLMPEEPYTAKSLAEMLDATMVIQFDTTTQEFVGYTISDESDGFSIDGGMGYIVNTPAGGMVKFTGMAWDNQPEMEESMDEDMMDDHTVEDMAEDMMDDDMMGENGGEEGNGAVAAAPALSTYKSAWAFIVTSDIRGMQAGTGYTVVAENLRTGTIATENITSDVKRSSAVWADLNRQSVVEAGDTLEIALYDEHGNVVSGPFQRTVTTADIRNAFLSLQLNVGDVRPKDTILAQNFPNPFNPETWIPYQLSEPADVSISIHNIAGQLVRTLDLGLQPVGSYMTPATAAYWDGKNAVGERVSSGIYFYTLQTAEFAATRRMVILK